MQVPFGFVAEECAHRLPSKQASLAPVEARELVILQLPEECKDREILDMKAETNLPKLYPD
jgi:hypothetical protein